MELGPIIASMRKNRIGVILIAVQIAVTFAVVLNCVNLAREEVRKINEPSGLDVPSILVVSAEHYDGKLNDEAFEQEMITQDLAWLRAQDGVVASSNVRHIPLSGSGSSNRREPKDHPERATGFCIFLGDQQVLDTYGIELVAGRVFTEDEVKSGAKVVMITQALADALFPEGDALGQVLYGDQGPEERVIGIVKHMVGSWRGWPGFDRNAIYPKRDNFFGGKLRYLVRVEPGSRDRLIPLIEEQMLSVYPDRLIEARPLQEYKDDHYRNSYAISRTLFGISIILIIVTALGIAGLTSFWVTQRTRQVGIRRALGARRVDILRYFLVENTCVTIIGLMLGVVLAFVLNGQMVANTSIMTPLPTVYLPIGMISLWLLGLASVYVPANRAAKIDPAIATRS